MDDLQVGRYTIPADELEETFSTSGGPGGQHANRNETSVRLRFHVAESSLPEDVRTRLTDRLGDPVEATATDSRSQFRNRALARQRLREKIESALKDDPSRRATKPTKASKQRRVEAKRARSETKRLRRSPPTDD
jgi:ribosome-associated protein